MATTYAVIVKGYRDEPVEDGSPLFLRTYEAADQRGALELAQGWADGRLIVGISQALPSGGMRIDQVKPVEPVKPSYSVNGPATTLG